MLENLYFLVASLTAGISIAFGICFIYIKTPEVMALHNYRKARIIMAVAYLSLAALYILELSSRTETPDAQLSRMTKLLVAAPQALLFTYMLINLFDFRFATKKKIVLESLPILSLGVMLFLAYCFELGERIFNITFVIFTAYYLSMLLRYTIVFQRKFRRYTRQIDNFFSEEESERLRWIQYSFYLALFVGIATLVLMFFESEHFYVVFTLIVIFFYTYFGVEFINYPIAFKQISIAVEEDEELFQRNYDDYEEDIEEDIDLDLRIKEWIDAKRFTKKGITIGDVAKRTKTNRTYLSNYINQNEEKSFREWIAILRVEESKQLMLDFPEKNISEIGEMVGFSDRSNFGRNFRIYVGISPSVWRKSNVSQTVGAKEVENI